jgi:hypothetical protein
VRVFERLTALEVPCILIREPDLGNQATAIGVVPCLKRRVRAALSVLSLFTGVVHESGSPRCD